MTKQKRSKFLPCPYHSMNKCGPYSCNAQVLQRWLKKSKRIFSEKNNHGFTQWDRGCDLARDIFRTLDPIGFKK